MSEAPYQLKQHFQFGNTRVEILQGDILNPGVVVHFLVSTDDNYLTMGSGVSAALREKAGPEYIREAQNQCPAIAGTAVVTGAHDLVLHEPLQHLRNVLHGTVIDYDTEEPALEQLVHRTTTNCLTQAEELIQEALAGGQAPEEWSILFPAFATGSGDLPMDICARQMCSAIKAYLTRERLLKRIAIILYVDPAEEKKCEDNNQEFVVGANKVLDVPNDPTENRPRTEDVWDREVEMQQLFEIIAGVAPQNKRHAIVLGGPRVGKSLFLDRLIEQAREGDDPPNGNRTLVKVSFGCLHTNTPPSFIYQKLLCALGEAEQDPELQREIRKVYAEIGSLADQGAAKEVAEESCNRLLDFLEIHRDRYARIVFFVDNLPVLLDMEADDPEAPKEAREFWRYIDKLGEHGVHFISTARDDQQYELLLDRLSDQFREQILEIRLRGVSKPERKEWINDIFLRYLGREATEVKHVFDEHDFIEEEAGLHPYLIALASYALIEPLKRYIIDQQEYPEEPGYDYLAPFYRQARRTIDGPRREFFGQLMATPTGELRSDLRNLSRAVAHEEELLQLQDEIQQLLKENAKDRNVESRLKELGAVENYRENLHHKSLQQLEAWGYLVDAEYPKKVQFIARPFWLYVQEFFRTPSPTGQVAEPKDLSISLLWSRSELAKTPEPEEDPEKTNENEPSMIRTMLRGRGARILTRQKPFSPEIKQEFMDSFERLINYRLHPAQYDGPGEFRDLEEVGNYILTQFTTVEIKRHLQELPLGSTILLMIDDMLKDIPWELMLETAYASEIPFRVGRVVISSQEPSPIRPAVRGPGKIKALLIADPTGDGKPDLVHARREVEWLYDTLSRDDRFDEPDVLIGAQQCQRIRILNHLSNGGYGLVHYSGHSRYDGQRSAWQLKDGKMITTDQLTNAIQMAPPALVFSSSCESAEASEAGPIEYESQAFDLPSSYLQAGVEAYIGTLWNVYEEPAERFVQEFYSAFLSTEYNLGECMRLAKWTLKQSGEWRERIHWLSFVLYGDPHTWPGDLFPIMRKHDDYM